MHYTLAAQEVGAEELLIITLTAIAAGSTFVLRPFLSFWVVAIFIVTSLLTTSFTLRNLAFPFALAIATWVTMCLYSCILHSIASGKMWPLNWLSRKMLLDLLHKLGEKKDPFAPFVAKMPDATSHIRRFYTLVRWKYQVDLIPPLTEEQSENIVTVS
jgi:hypothetical protein